MVNRKYFKFILLFTIIFSFVFANVSWKSSTLSNIVQAQLSSPSTVSVETKPSVYQSSKSDTNNSTPSTIPVEAKPLVSQPPQGDVKTSSTASPSVSKNPSTKSVSNPTASSAATNNQPPSEKPEGNKPLNENLAISSWANMPSKACLPDSITATPSPIFVLAKIDSVIANQDTSLIQLRCGGNSNKQLDSILTKNPNSIAFLKQFKEGDQVSLEYQQNGKEFILRNISIDFKQIDWLLSLAIYFVSMLAFYLLIYWFTRKGKSLSGLNGLMIGEDGRYSNSRTQIALWFFILISTYVAVTFTRVIHGGVDFAGGIGIPTNLLFLSGISAFTYATAKQITKSETSVLEYFGVKNLAELQESLAKKDVNDLKNTKEAMDFKSLKDKQSVLPSSSSTSQPLTVKPNFFHDLFYRGGSDSLDLGDFQMIIITFLTITIYIVQIVGYLGALSLHKSVILPDVDSTLLATFGLGQSAYLAKKFIDKTGNSPEQSP
jgi:hypothetical protein